VKYIIVLLLACVMLFYYVIQEKKMEKEAVQKQSVQKVISKSTSEKKVHLTPKKKNFIHLVLPAIDNTYKRLEARYYKISQDMKNHTNQEEIQRLKKKYNAKSDEDLLARLKPHPVSIVLAQAAMESSWATSRFTKEANNIFGMWSINENEPRIAAGETRDGNRTIWLKKFETIDDAVQAYYDMIARGGAYQRLRVLRMQYDNPYKITPGLDKYSEMGADYGNIVNKLIKYNQFTKYDKH